MSSNVADRVLISKRVFTGLDDEAQNRAIGICGDRIAWVCRPDLAGDAEHPVSSDARIEDFGSRFIMPGFIDAHLHFFHSALFSSSLAKMFVGKSEADCVEEMISFSKGRSGEGWLLAQGWREYVWDIPETPSKHSLDRAFPDRPVALYSGDAHTLWLNSRALQELSIDESSIAPRGGSYDKDESGHLTGIVREVAAMELMPKIVSSFSIEELVDAYLGFIRELNEHGITSVCDMALSATEGSDFIREDIYERIERDGALTIRVNLFPTLLEDRARFHSLRDRLTGDLIRVGGHKQFLDGVSSQHTAWLKAEYANARFDGDNGRPTIDPHMMDALVENAVLDGETVRVHTIGDQAIHEMLDIYERTSCKKDKLEADADVGRLVLEHLENFQEEDIARISSLGVIASVQPRHMTLDPEGPMKDLGEARVRFAWPLESLSKQGAVLAFGTDSPVVDIDPFRNIYTAITRRDSMTKEMNPGFDTEECIDISSALKAYTFGSAKAAGREEEVGLIDEGYFADLIIVDTDLLNATPDEILTAHIMRTYVGGNLVFEESDPHA